LLQWFSSRCNICIELLPVLLNLATMKRTIFLYGLALAVLISLLKFLEYRLFVRDLSTEFYVGIIAIMFTVLGVWVGFKLTRKKQIIITNSNFQFDETRLEKFGISKREYEVLQLMSKGHSNQEIADKLFVSLNTVKTHSSNLFLKLEAKRRTQAIQRAKELQLIP
jgi:NarL family two-component system response regulator LiaR